MHHSSLDNEDTVTAKLYAIMTTRGALGQWQSPLSLMAALEVKYGVKVTAISTYMSSIRLQLLDCFPDWGQELHGPRDQQPTEAEREVLGKGNFYRVRKTATTVAAGQMSLAGMNEGVSRWER